MDDDFGIRKLVELIFVKNFKVTSEMTDTGSFPASLLVNNFPEKLHHVLFARNVIISAKWFREFDHFTSNMLPTEDSYLSFIIFACYLDHYCHPNIFDCFISLCGFVRYFCMETLHKKGVNFGHLNSAIVMTFYEHVMKKTFIRCGGYLRLLEYIRQHKYHRWNWHLKDIYSPDPKTHKSIEKEITRESDTMISVKKDMSAIRESAERIKKNVILTMSVELSTLLGSHDSDQTLGASKLQDTAKTDKKKTATQFDPESLEKDIQGSWNSDSKTLHVPKYKEDIAWCEGIVQAVTRHNESKAAGLATLDSSTLKQAEKILEHLKVSIESLIKVLEGYDKE